MRVFVVFVIVVLVIVGMLKRVQWRRGQERMRRAEETRREAPMTLRDCIGVRFSELRGNHQRDTTYWWNDYDSSKKSGLYKNERELDRYGNLPDGGCYGVGHLPNWADPWQRDFQYIVVGADGEIMGGSGQIDHGEGWHPSPDALVATPAGDAIVWLEDGKLWAWQKDSEGEWGFGKRRNVSRIILPNHAAVIDARMNADGTLDVWCADDAHFVYSCHGGVVFSLNEQESAW